MNIKRPAQRDWVSFYKGVIELISHLRITGRPKVEESTIIMFN